MGSCGAWQRRHVVAACPLGIMLSTPSRSCRLSEVNMVNVCLHISVFQSFLRQICTLSFWVKLSEFHELRLCCMFCWTCVSHIFKRAPQSLRGSLGEVLR